MKILKPGKVPDPWAKRASCEKCGAEFEYSKEDVVTTDLIAYVRVVLCPTPDCGHLISDPIA